MQSPRHVRCVPSDFYSQFVPMTKSFLARVIESFESRSNRTAMRIVGDERQVYTFGETLRQIRAISYRLKMEGIEAGDRVALIGENHPSWAIAYLGILYRGAVCVPMDPDGAVGTLKNFLENSEAKIAFVGEDVEEKIRKITLEQDLPIVVWPVETQSDPNRADNDFHTWASAEFPESY